MKLIILSYFLTIVNCSIGQQPETLKTLLKENFPNNSKIDGHWVYFGSDPSVFKSNIIDSLNPQLKLYKVSMTNVLGRHVSTDDCIIIVEKEKSAVNLIEPIFYSDDIKELSKLVLGKKLYDSSAFVNLITEMQIILGIGGVGHFENLQYSNSLVTFEYVIIRGNKKQIWRKFSVHHSNYTISDITSNKNQKT